jgi:hypothetical protein
VEYLAHFNLNCNGLLSGTFTQLKQTRSHLFSLSLSHTQRVRNCSDDIPFFETSAKTDVNVQTAFQSLVDAVLVRVGDTGDGGKGGGGKSKTKKVVMGSPSGDASGAGDGGDADGGGGKCCVLM